MALTQAQKTTFKTDVLADPALSVLPPSPDNAFYIADAYNLTASPDFYVWRTSVSEHEITGQTSPDGTTWSWTSYIARTVGEQNGWVRMFNTSLTVNPSLPNVRQGMADIFSGSANGAAAQRTHLLAMGKRKATRVEKLLAAGTGSLSTPATMGYEGPLTYQDVMSAMGW